MQTQNKKEPIFSFGAIADCQYHSRPPEEDLFYNHSSTKLRDIVEHFNSLSPNFIIQLGDLIDGDLDSFHKILPIFQGIKAQKYMVLGNHDFEVGDRNKKAVPDILDMKERYYSFAINGWRCVVLDGNDISLAAYPSDSSRHQYSKSFYKELGEESFPHWGGALDQSQLNWFKEILEKSQQKKERVIIFSHFPIYPENRKYNLWNDLELLEILKKYKHVAAYINGHHHSGDYAFKNGIHFLTLKALVETDQSAYTYFEVFADSIKVNGFGREESRLLKLT